LRQSLAWAARAARATVVVNVSHFFSARTPSLRLPDYCRHFVLAQLPTMTDKKVRRRFRPARAAVARRTLARRVRAPLLTVARHAAPARRPSSRMPT
jgi:hypothetical protein